MQTDEWKEKSFTQQLNISWTSKVIYEVHRKMLRLYSKLGILWNLQLFAGLLIIISLKSFRWYIFTNNLIHSGTAEGSGGERKYSKIKLIHFADAKNYNNAFLSFLMLKSWPQSCFFPLSFGHYFPNQVCVNLRVLFSVELMKAQELLYEVQTEVKRKVKLGERNLKSY